MNVNNLPVAPTAPDDWPALPLDAWRETYATLHLWTQIVGKVRLALSPPVNHWWHVTLYVTTRVLTTSPIPYGSRTFMVDFDFIDHVLRMRPGADRVMREAYSHEVFSGGFWPGSGLVQEAAFYTYAAPAPPGFDRAAIQPTSAWYSTDSGEYLLRYEDTRCADDPDAMLLEFLQSTYEAAADLAGWDRPALERERWEEQHYGNTLHAPQSDSRCSSQPPAIR